MARTDGFKVAAFTITTETTADWASVPGREQTLNDVNFWIRTHRWLYDYLVDAQAYCPVLYTIGNEATSLDGVHYLTVVAEGIAKVAYNALQNNETPQPLNGGGTLNLTVSNAFAGSFTGDGGGLTNFFTWGCANGNGDPAHAVTGDGVAFLPVAPVNFQQISLRGFTFGDGALTNAAAGCFAINASVNVIPIGAAGAATAAVFTNGVQFCAAMHNPGFGGCQLFSLAPPIVYFPVGTRFDLRVQYATNLDYYIDYVGFRMESR